MGETFPPLKSPPLSAPPPPPPLPPVLSLIEPRPHTQAQENTLRFIVVSWFFCTLSLDFIIGVLVLVFGFVVAVVVAVAVVAVVVVVVLLLLLWILLLLLLNGVRVCIMHGTSSRNKSLRAFLVFLFFVSWQINILVSL